MEQTALVEMAFQVVAVLVISTVARELELLVRVVTE
jgi:hypothetical protein